MLSLKVTWSSSHAGQDVNVALITGGEMVCDLSMGCFLFHLKMLESVILPAYKGSTFHGGFSHALTAISPGSRKIFFPDKAGQTNPFILIPPLTRQRKIARGEALQAGIILFGSALHWFPVIFTALEYLGRELGLGSGNGKYTIEAIEELSADSRIELFAAGKWRNQWQGTTLSEIVMLNADMESTQIHLHSLTGLRLKHKGALQRTPPPFWLFFERLLGRLNSLIAFYGEGQPLPPEKKKELLLAANAVSLDNAATTARWYEWQRPPKAGRQTMNFGSLQGTLVYSGYITPFLPWLLAGQWTGIGGKTSFGLGLYNLENRKR